MTRDELEAVIWRHITRPEGLQHAQTAVDAILAAADAYMVAEGGLTAERRAVLEQATTRRKART